MNILKKLVGMVTVDSRRVKAALASILVAVLGSRIGLSESQVTMVVEALWVLIAALAAGDLGKEKAKIEERQTAEALKALSVGKLKTQARK